MNKDIKEYNDSQQKNERGICELLSSVIETSLPDAESKIWHGAPVWFLDGNPIVGYDVLKNCVRLLFWSGQSFDEDGLQKEGSFKAAEARYATINDVDTTKLKQWLEKSKTIQWDYKKIVKRRGVLERL